MLQKLLTAEAATAQQNIDPSNQVCVTTG